MGYKGRMREVGTMDCMKTIYGGVCHLLEAFLSIQLWVLLGVMGIYYHHRLTPDWPFVALVGMLIAFRQAKGLIDAWKGRAAL